MPHTDQSLYSSRGNCCPIVCIIFKTTPDPRLRAGCQAVLMAARGRRHHQMVDDVGVSVRTLQHWLNTYKEHGLTGLLIRWALGRTSKIPVTLAPEILTWGKHGPTACGSDRANWTYAKLATHLYRTLGLIVSANSMRIFCTRYHVQHYRSAYRYRKAGPVQQEWAR